MHLSRRQTLAACAAAAALPGALWSRPARAAIGTSIAGGALGAARLAWLGAELDPDANEAGSRRISTAASRVQLLVIPTDEESIIAQEAVSEEAAT